MNRCPASFNLPLAFGSKDSLDPVLEVSGCSAEQEPASFED
jgi:hypothetical protein